MGEGSGIIYSKYLNFESTKGYLPAPIWARTRNCQGAGWSAAPSAPAHFAHTPHSTSKTHPRAFSPAGFSTLPSRLVPFCSGNTYCKCWHRPQRCPCWGPHCPPWAGKQEGWEAPALPPKSCSTSQPLPVFVGRLRALHETELEVVATSVWRWLLSW